MKDEREMFRKMYSAKPKRAPFVNGWLIWSLSILGVCIMAPIGMGDFVTWATWSGCVLLVLGARSYQYFIQRK